MAVSPASTQAQAQRTPKAERLAVQKYVKAHTKPSQLDKFWSSIKKSLDIK